MGDTSLEDRINELVKKINRLEDELRKEKETNVLLLKELAIIRNILTMSSLTYNSSKKVVLLSRSLKAGELAKDIVEILMTEGPLNISQLTNKLKEVRGKASRKTVSAKLVELLSLGLVETVEGKKSEKLYKLKDSE
jgi:Fic family protein